MPIHLNSISRRHFLGTTAVASIAPLTSSLFAADDSKPQTWALLADTHIAADPALEARGTNMVENLKKVVAEITAEKDSIAGVIIDGDIAYNEGLHGDYETFVSVIGELARNGMPLHMTLGNHDDRTVFRETFADHTDPPPVMIEKHVSLIETPLANWILLDTLRYVNKVEGEIGEKQIEWLTGLLDAHPDKPAILVGHHYPQIFREDVVPTDKEKIKISGLIDSEPFLDALAKRTQAKAYIFGHSHYWKTGKSKSGLHEVNLPPTGYVFDPVRPNGWVKATVSESGMDLELRALDTSHEQHGKTTSLNWR